MPTQVEFYLTSTFELEKAKAVLTKATDAKNAARAAADNDHVTALKDIDVQFDPLIASASDAVETAQENLKAALEN